MRQTCARAGQPAIGARLAFLGVEPLRLRQIGDDLRRDFKRAPLLPVAMSHCGDHDTLPWGPGIGEAERHRLRRHGLIGFQDDEIVPPFRTI